MSSRTPIADIALAGLERLGGVAATTEVAKELRWPVHRTYSALARLAGWDLVERIGMRFGVPRCVVWRAVMRQSCLAM